MDAATIFDVRNLKKFDMNEKAVVRTWLLMYLFELLIIGIIPQHIEYYPLILDLKFLWDLRKEIVFKLKKLQMMMSHVQKL